MKKVLLVCSLALTGILGATIVSCGNNEQTDNPGGNTPTDGFDTSKSITLYSREAGSGTRECFFEGIGYGDVKKEDKWESGVKVQSVGSNGDIMTKVGSDDYAIGYCSLDSLGEGKGIKGLQYEGVTASEESAVDGTYKLKRNFNYVVRSDNDYTNEDMKLAKNAFVAYMTESKEGLLTIQQNGGIINTKQLSIADAENWSTIAEERFAGLKDIDAVTLNACGSTSVEKVLTGLASQFNTLTSGKVTVKPNQSGSGDAVTGVTEGKNNTKFDLGFLSREIEDSEKATMAEYKITMSGAICIDAVVPIVNSDNTVLTNTTAELLTAIYKGTYKTWADVAEAL